jgi:hypothetical protein
MQVYRFASRIVVLLLVLALIIPSIAFIPDSLQVAQAQEPSVDISNFAVRFDTNGVTYAFDASFDNLVEVELQVVVWAWNDSGETYLYNETGDDEYTTDETGLLYGLIEVEPTFTPDYQEEIEVFIPYDQFPFVDYDYTYDPVVIIDTVISKERLLVERMSNHTVRVFGEEDPYGYRAFLSIREITVHDAVEDGLFVDEILFIYQLSETTGEWDQPELAGNEFKLYEFDMQADAGTMDKGDVIPPEAFRWLEVYVLAERDLWVSFTLTEVVDNEAALEYAGLLNEFVAGGATLAAPFVMSNPVGAMGVAIAAAAATIFNIGVNIYNLLDEATIIGESHERITPAQLAGMYEDDTTWDRTYRFSDGDFDYEVVVSVYLWPYLRQAMYE